MRLFLCAFTLCFVSCAAVPPPVPLSALEIRAIQTREYPTRSTTMVMKAVLNVLQDEGFIAKNAVPELGLITATKEIDLERENDRFWNTFLGGRDARWPKNSVIEANANVSEFGDDTRVRITFQRKVFDNTGAVVSVQSIESAQYYQEFFSKVDKGIFIQKERI